ncbi:MAG: hypothetical protein LBM93_12885 [Oscillospiraceae bacterium]|jgi:hypothetical protein|nr:hypothetical protein [Oscillospiraceae bacterium]
MRKFTKYIALLTAITGIFCACANIENTTQKPVETSETAEVTEITTIPEGYITVGEKVTTAQENEPTDYEKGYAKGLFDGGKDAKNGVENESFIDYTALKGEGYQKGFVDGYTKGFQENTENTHTIALCPKGWTTYSTSDNRIRFNMPEGVILGVEDNAVIPIYPSGEEVLLAYSETLSFAIVDKVKNGFFEYLNTKGLKLEDILEFTETTYAGRKGYQASVQIQGKPIAEGYFLQSTGISGYFVLIYKQVDSETLVDFEQNLYLY